MVFLTTVYTGLQLFNIILSIFHGGIDKLILGLLSKPQLCLEL